MEYNTQRGNLNIPEYGRNVQRMVNYCLSIEDRDQRNKVAQSIIDVMGNLNPHLRDVPDFKHKLWDHLFIMSKFELDVDSPYPIPTPQTFEERPDNVPYPDKQSKYRYYGHIVRKMVDYTSKLEEGDLKEGLKIAIANQMKKSYLMWNKDTVDDMVIFQELAEMSEGKLKLAGVELSQHQQYKNQAQQNKGRRNKKKRRYKK